MISRLTSLTIIRLVRPVAPFGTIPPPEILTKTNKIHQEKEEEEKTANIYLIMNCACFWVFLARVGQNFTNVQRDGSTKDNILNFPNWVQLSSQ